ncbi:MAG: hypothetical protein AAGB34_01180 [Planctomycetota bacterium]
MRHHIIKLATLAAALLALTACASRSYQTFPNASAASERVHRTFAEQSANIDLLRGSDPEMFDERRRYLGKIIKQFSEYERARAELLAERVTPREARQLDEAMVIGYNLFDTLAVFPGRIDEEGEAVDEETRQALADAPELPES